MRTRLIQNIEYDKISVMSDLAFHTGVENRFKYACLAMRKAAAAEVCLRVYSWKRMMNFVGLIICFGRSSPPLLFPTAVLIHWICKEAAWPFPTHAADLPDAELLVLLTHGAPIDTKALMERFPKIIDIVGRDDPELTEGRHRYVAYKRQGIEPTVVKRG